MKKVLVISTVTTHPVKAGNQRCILEYCKLLRKLDLDLHFLLIKGRVNLSCDDYGEFREFWGDRLHVFNRKLFTDLWFRLLSSIRVKFTGYNKIDDLYPSGLTKYVKLLVDRETFDYVIVNYVILSKLFEAHLNCKKVLFTHDVFSYKKERLGVSKFWFDLKPDEEAKGLNRADVILSIQDNETVFFQYLCPLSIIRTVYSPFPAIKQKLTFNNRILFLSGASPLNVNGIFYFIREVFPLVKKKRPNTQLIIAGGICQVLKIEDTNNILLFGKVDNEQDFYALGDIVINPIYQGTGLKIKTFEALSYGKIVIAHPHSAEGIYNSFQTPLLIGKTPEEFSTYLIRVLDDLKLRMEYSSKALSYINEMNNYIENEYKKLLFDN